MTATDTIRNQADTLRLDAPAKVNLFLEITGTRADGYHTIDSLMGVLDVADVVRLTPSESLSIALDGPFAGQAPAGEGNLAVRAVRRLEERTGRELPVAIHIEKHIPAGAGLGGGSADAAAVLRGMRQLFDLELDDAALAEVGLGLGADVPACLAGAPVLVRGIGDEVAAAAAVPDLHLVLVHPGVSLSTPDVYKAYDRNHSDCSCCGGGQMFMPISQIDAIAQRRNDLENAAIDLEPAIASALGLLSGAQGCQLARMSGSGTACFGIFGDDGLAAAARQRIQEEAPGWWVRSARLAGSET